MRMLLMGVGKGDDGEDDLLEDASPKYDDSEAAVIFRNDLARPAVPQEFYLLVNFGPIGPYFRQIVGLESSFKNI